MKFYQISHSNEQDIKVILASTRYEAIGFYLFEEVDYIDSTALDKVKTLPPDYSIAVSREGYQINKTVEELWEEKDNWILPKTVLSKT